MRKPLLGIAAAVVCLCPVQALAQSPPRAAWGFEEGAGNVAADSSANGNNGTLVNGPTWTPGRIGSSLSFDGVDDQIQVDDSVSLQVTSGVTTSAWIKLPNQANPAATVLAKEGGGATPSYALHLSSWGWPQFFVRTAEGLQMGQLPMSLAKGRWVHVAATYDGASIRIYVDGELLATTQVSGSVVNGTGVLWIGSDQYWGGRFTGLIDEVRVYDRALTLAEIQGDMTLSADPGAPLQISSQRPTSGAVGVRLPPAITFNGAMDPASLTDSTVRLETVGGSSIATTLAFDAQTRTVTITPISALTASTVYRVRVSGGETGVASAECTHLPSDVSWTFTSAAENGVGGFWGFEENAGTVAADSTGNGNSGLISGGAAWAAGRIGGALEFDGMNDSVYVADSEALDLTNGVTMSAWIKLAAQPTFQTIVLKLKQPTGGTSYGLVFDGGYLKTYVTVPDGLRQVGINGPFALNEWMHVAGTYDGSFLRLYVNGELRATEDASGPVATGSGPMYIGAYPWGPYPWGDWFNGVIDEVRVYDHALPVSALLNDMTLSADPAAPLQVSSQTPAAGANGIRSTPITATFSAAMTDASLTASTLRLETLGGTVLSATPAYNSLTRTVSLSPTASLVPLTSYRVVVVGGAGGVASATGSTLASNVSWTFTTAAANGLGAFWGLDDNAGTSAFDSTGNGNTGTLLNGPTWSPGKYGGALSFDGTNDIVRVLHNDTLNFTTSMTMSAWINLSAQPTWKTLLSKEIPNSTSYQLSFDGNNRLFGYLRFPDGMRSVSLSNPLPLNQWIHVAVTYDGTLIKLYIDGEERSIDYATGSMMTSNRPLRIGGDQWGDYFPGLIDEVRLYDRGLSAEEVRNDRTLPIDPVAPLQVTAVTPAPNASGVRYTPITATFSAPMNAAIVNAVVRLETLSGSAVGTTKAYNPTTRTITLTPSGSGLSPLTGYRLRVLAGATSVTGQVLGAEFSSIFHTAASGTVAGAWALNEGAGSTTIDSSANGNTGTLLGPTWSAGKSSNGLSFDGVDDRVRIEDADTLDIPGNITITAWIRLSSYKDWSTILSKEAHVLDHSYALWVTSEHKVAAHFMLGGVGYGLAAPNVVPLNVWTHVAATYDGTVLRIFLDGVEVASRTATGTFANTSGPLWIGGDQSAVDYFPGTIDEVRLYGRALATSEVQSISSQAVTSAAPPAPIASPPGGVFAQVPAVSLLAVPGAIIRYTIDNSSPAATSPMYTEPIVLPANGVTLRAVAFLGSTSGAQLIQTYTLDTTAPTITAQPFPAAVNDWHMTPVTVSFHCGDNGAIVTCSAPATIAAEGAGQVVVGTAVDWTGRQATVNATINVDLTPPVVALSAPQDMLTTASTSIAVSGFVSDALSGLVAVKCNDVNATVVDGQATCTVPLRSGRNSIALTARDAAGHSTSAAVTVTRASTSASLRLSPSTRTMLVGEAATLSLRDSFGIAVTGAQWTSSDQSVVSLSVDDPPVLTAVAAGNTTISVTKNGVTSQATITVVAGDVLPDWTTRWIVPPTPAQLRRDPPIYTHPIDGSGPDLFTVETDMNTSPERRTVRAVTASGEVQWIMTAPGVPLMGDAFGGLIAGVDKTPVPCRAVFGEFERCYTALARFAGPQNTVSWRYESAGWIDRPAQGPDGTIYFLEHQLNFSAGNGDGFSKSIVIVNGATGQVTARLPLAYFISVQDTAGPNNGCDIYAEDAPWTAGPIVGADGFGYVAVSKRKHSQVVDCSSSTVVRSEREVGLTLLKLSGTGQVGAHVIDLRQCFTGVFCDAPRPQQLLPDGLGGILIAALWDTGNRVTRLNGDGNRTDTSLSNGTRIELIGQGGKAYLNTKTSTTTSSSKQVVDVASWTPVWNLPVDWNWVAAGPDGGGTAERNGVLGHYDGTGELVSTIALGLIDPVQAYYSWIGNADDGLRATAVPFDDRTHFNFTYRSVGPASETPRAFGNRENQVAVTPVCKDGPRPSPVTTGWPAGTTVHYAVTDPTNWTTSQLDALDAAFNEWKTVSTVNGFGVDFQKATGQTPLVTFRKGSLQDPKVRARGQLLRDFGPAPTATQSVSLIVTDDTFKLRDFVGYLKMALHEIGHSMGLDDAQGMNQTSVMNQFSQHPSRPKELGGLRDDPLNWIASSVTPCDVQAVQKSRAR